MTKKEKQVKIKAGIRRRKPKFKTSIISERAKSATRFRFKITKSNGLTDHYSTVLI